MDTNENGNYIYITNLEFFTEYRLRRVSTDTNPSNPKNIIGNKVYVYI
jgi:hypothetical protein